MSNITDKEILLKEYEMCQRDARGIEAPIWQTSAIIGFGSVATIIWLLTKSTNSSMEQIDLPTITGIAIFILGLVFTWLKMALRWWSIQHTLFLRMCHIEKDLKILKTQQYILRRNEVRQYGKEFEYLIKIELPKDKLYELDNVHNYAIFGTRFYGIFFLGFNYFSWAIYIAYQSSLFDTFSFKNCIPPISYLGSLGIFFAFTWFCGHMKTRAEKNRVEKKRKERGNKR